MVWVNQRTAPEAGQRAVWTFDLDLAKIRKRVLIGVAAVVVLDVLASIGAAEKAPFIITRLFDGDLKMNVPTLWKISFLAMDALLMLALARLGARTGDPFTKGWKLLAFVTGFAFFDEGTYLHQSIGRFLERHLHTSGPLEYAWTILYLPMAIAVAIVLVRHVRHLESGARIRVLGAGILYWVGAICFEPLKSEISETSDGSLEFKLVAAASDSFELIGMTLLFVFLLTELVRRAQQVRVRLG